MQHSANGLDDVHVLNLIFLTTVQKTCNEDAVRASSLFGLTTTEIEIIKSLSIESIHSLAFRVHQCIALLRFAAEDISALCNVPAPIQSLYAAVQSPLSDRPALSH